MAHHGTVILISYPQIPAVVRLCFPTNVYVSVR